MMRGTDIVIVKKEGVLMIYSNTSQGAILAAERQRLGNYGLDRDEDASKECPYCGYSNPEEFYVGDMGCVGCSECVKRVDCEDWEE